MCMAMEGLNCNLSCRYKREEAKIQAWVDLQSAKAEAQLRKLEVLHYQSFTYYRQHVQ